MTKRYTDEFRRDAVRMATTSGLGTVDIHLELMIAEQRQIMAA